jgi:Sugar (and other) transporter
MTQFTLLFTAIYSFTVGPAAYSLAAESFPSSVREAGMAVCVFINMTSLGILLLIYPFVTDPIGYTASLCIFVGFSDPIWTC